MTAGARGSLPVVSKPVNTSRLPRPSRARGWGQLCRPGGSEGGSTASAEPCPGTEDRDRPLAWGAASGGVFPNGR